MFKKKKKDKPYLCSIPIRSKRKISQSLFATLPFTLTMSHFLREKKKRYTIIFLFKKLYNMEICNQINF